MPKPALHLLLWSPEDNTYKLFMQPDMDIPFLQIFDEPWFDWLTTHAAFSFQGEQGSLSLQKEARPRGGDGYWYAYRRQGNRMLKKYAGRSMSLSIARLEELAQALDGKGDPSSPTGKARPRSAPLNLAAVSPRREQSVIQASATRQLPLLVPKLHPPRLRTSFLARERLLTLLDLGLERKLTLLVAPAGFGKTTCVCTWLALREDQLPPVAWIALDSGDNDPFRFWRYLSTACQKFQNVARQATFVPQQTAFQRISLEALLIGLLNELMDIPGEGILVLEDYHLITEPEIHQALNYFLEHLPPCLHLFLLTRSEPPLPLASLRAHDELVEIREAQLRFSVEETRTFLQRALPFPLEQALPAHLHRLTEGWITGLHLISLVLHHESQGSMEEIQQMLDSFSGGQRHILEYLVSDVLSTQPQQVQTFLLKTVGLNRFNSSLCAAVTEQADSHLLLIQIEHAHLFLVPIDGSGEGTDQWYRYHALFAEVMQHEARRRLGEAVLRLCASKASQWFEQHELLNDAIETALTAEETARAATLITSIIEKLNINQINEYHTLARWLARLPESLLLHGPLLSQASAMVLLFQPGPPTLESKRLLEHYLQMAEDSLRNTANWSRLGEVLAMRSMIAGQWNDFTTATHYAREALELLPARPSIWHGISLSSLGAEALLTGQVNEAQQLIQQAQALAEYVGDLHGLRAINNALGTIFLSQGKLHQAAEIYRQVLVLAGDDRFDRGYALAGLATLSYEWNQLAEAERLARDAWALSSDFVHDLLRLFASLILARVLHTRGQTEQAREVLKMLSTSVTQQRWQREIETWLAWISLASGDLAATQQWLAYHRPEDDDETLSEAQQEREALLMARLLLVQGKAQAALPLLHYWQAKARSQGRTRSELEIRILLAMTSFDLNQRSEACQQLKEVLQICQPMGYRRIFLDEGKQIIPLLKASLAVIQEKPFIASIRSLLYAFSSEPGIGQSMAHAPLLEPLSPQERRVLRLLATGRTYPEIASELIVSINTIKAQIKSIYRKLDVNNRLEASEVARQLHLL